MVRVRIAPSPTGFAHIGTAYTALFNFAFAKKNKGQFILRLEDTDVKRNVEGAEQAIYEGLSWLGLFWDEGPDKGGNFGPYRQSERLDIYQEKAQELIKRGLAYKEGGAIVFKSRKMNVEWDDLIRGKISFPSQEMKDFVIVKSDGFPTYNFAVVVDDLAMKITHVIRGEEHISNTPRQLALYFAFGERPPFFAHLPTLRNQDRKKLSKRRDPVDLRIYKNQGYLPEALINFLCLLGWSHPQGKEIFPLSEFVELFDLKRVRKAGPIFDMNKLDWLNKHYISQLNDEEFFSYQKMVSQFRNEKNFSKVVKFMGPLIKTRIKTLKEFDSLAYFFFERPKLDHKLFGRKKSLHLKSAYEAISSISNWEMSEINKSLLEIVKKRNFETSDFFMDLRVAITGKSVTPPINESIFVLGKKEVLERIKKSV